MNKLSIGSQVKISGSNIVGVLVKKGFIMGNFMYTVLTENDDEYNVYQVEGV